MNSPEADKVLFVRKCHDSFTVLFGDREQELERALYTFSEFAVKPFEDEVRVLFRDGARRVTCDLVSEDDVVQGEEDRRAVWEVGDYQCVGNTTVLVHDDEVRHRIATAGGA